MTKNLLINLPPVCAVRLPMLLLLLLAALPAFAQHSKEEEKILAEAWLLYNSERASWHGTDMFIEKYPERHKKAGGYFSYTEDKVHKCVFFDREQTPGVLFSVTFDDSFVIEAAEVDTVTRKFTQVETDLHAIRQKALELATTDTLFKHYNNASLNFIPVIVGKEKKVYILTGPSVSGVVIFGNDYLIEFDKKNNIKSKRALHKNIIPIEYGKETDSAITAHNHQESTGDLITATDICTLLLYGPYANWTTHIVMGKKNVSLWNCETNNLIVMTREAWEKIYADKEKD